MAKKRRKKIPSRKLTQARQQANKLAGTFPKPETPPRQAPASPQESEVVEKQDNTLAELEAVEPKSLTLLEAYSYGTDSNPDGAPYYFWDRWRNNVPPRSFHDWEQDGFASECGAHRDAVLTWLGHMIKALAYTSALVEETEGFCPTYWADDIVRVPFWSVGMVSDALSVAAGEAGSRYMRLAQVELDEDSRVEHEVHLTSRLVAVRCMNEQCTECDEETVAMLSSPALNAALASDDPSNGYLTPTFAMYLECSRTGSSGDWEWEDFCDMSSQELARNLGIKWLDGLPMDRPIHYTALPDELQTYSQEAAPFGIGYLV